MEKAASDTGQADITGPDLADGEPYLKPVRKKPELDEEDSPTASRRFTRA